MKRRHHRQVPVTAIVMPVVFALVLFGIQALQGDEFFRIGDLDAQQFFCTWSNNGYGNVRVWKLGGAYSDGPNQHFIDDRMYYSLLAEAGINYTAGIVINGDSISYLDSTEVYSGIKVWNANCGNVDKYGHSQCQPCGVGDRDWDYFDTPYNVGTAGPDPQFPYPGVFFCDRSEDSADTLIHHMFNRTFDWRLRERDYHLDLVFRVENIDTTVENPGVMWIDFGPPESGGEEIEPWDYYFPSGPWWVEHDTTQQSYNRQRFEIHVDDIDTTQYNTVTLTANFRIPYPNNIELNIYWSGLMDLYLDSLSICDRKYDDFVINEDSDLALSK